MTNEELIEMFREDIFPMQADHLLRLNFEGKGQLDKTEYLRDAAILLELAEKGLEAEWIPISERKPKDLEPVNISWVNHKPEPYYHDIKDKVFVDTGIYYKGQWYWYSATCADYLGEYGNNEIDKVDDAIEIVAWMPLPKPYKAEGSTE